ncbi:glycosyltransferase family 4 protein [Hoylesella loescheii]|uniref:glycosyltransferase family 4 protein n=1 Tax=Hoylesella loescheii TaxID=840 RepID=UPI00248DB4A0|nr:glycosyltransferase family 1 protein [Hoylesella loescheii]
MNKDKNIIVGFDAKRVVRNGTGLGAYGRNLVNDLAALYPHMQLLLYAPDEGREDLARQVKSAQNLCMVYPKGAKNALQKAAWRSRGVVKDLLRDGVNVFHGLSGELPKGVKAAGIDTVVTIHDLIFMRHPEFYHWWDALIYRWKFRQTLKEAHRIIAISECTKRDIVKFGHYPEDRISVIYQSCDTRFREQATPEKLREVSERYALPSRFVLNVGTIEARKNVLLAAKALKDVPKEVHLVVLGRPTPYINKVKSWVAHNGLSARVHFLHNVPNEDLPAIYQQAEVFAYPSRYEGFGIPIIEAIQSGLPVVACTGSCLEEAGGPHNLYVAPNDHKGMAKAINAMLKGQAGRDEAISQSMAYVQRFENKNVAEQVAHCLFGREKME